MFFIAYMYIEGRIGVFFFLLHTLFRMYFRKFIKKKNPKVSLIFFFVCKISNKKERYHKITHYIIVI